MDEKDLDAWHDTVLIGGRERREIVVIDYDPGWPGRFELEQDRIRNALGDTAHRIEHIGSTSVPGLAAKPIIDVLVTVPDPDDEPAFAPALERVGYELRVREPSHRMFRTPSRDVHLHVLADQDPEVARHLAFRDRLRVSPEDRARYEQLKRALAQREWSDMNHYANAKGPMIEEILARAESIRPACLDDATAIAGLLGELGYPIRPGDARARLQRLLCHGDRGALVYDIQGEPVALVTYQLIDLIYRQGPQCRITAMVVRGDRRRRGIARALLDAVESAARKRDCSRLEVTTRPAREDALGLYHACGFAERPARLVKFLDEPD